MATDFITPVNSSGVYLNATPIPINDVPQTFVYSGAFLSTITIQYYGNTYVQSFTNDGTNILTISGWVLQ